MLQQIEKIEVNYENLENIELILEQPFILAVNWNHVKYEFLIRLKKEMKNLLIFGNGAYNAEKMSPPIFQRHKWIEDIDDSIIIYNDPTLYLGKINLGWGQGLNERHYLSEIGDIFRAIMKKVMLEPNQVIFYGSSAGGFMSLLLAGMVKGSVAFVNNPQTIVPNYYINPVRKMYECAYPGMSQKDIEDKFKERLNVVEFYKSINYIPNIYYLQNISCMHDMKNHLTPFINGIKEFGDDLLLNKIHIELYSDKEKGHNPLDKDETLAYFDKVKSNN